MKVNVVVPALPSLCETSLIESVFPGGAPTGVSEKLSTAEAVVRAGRDVSESVQRIQNDAPLGMLSVSEELTAV